MTNEEIDRFGVQIKNLSVKLDVNTVNMQRKKVKTVPRFGALLGAIGAAYLHTRHDRPLQAIGQGASALSYGQRLKAALCTVVMIIVLVWSALQLPMNVEYDPDREQPSGVEDVQPDDGLFAGDGNGESAGVAWS